MPSLQIQEDVSLTFSLLASDLGPTEIEGSGIPLSNYATDSETPQNKILNKLLARVALALNSIQKLANGNCI